jgi:selenocysteine-specific elongation factor
MLARVRDHLVLRSYSPVTTIGGGRVAETLPRKRRAMSAGEDDLLQARIGGSAEESVQALLEMTAWDGVPLNSLPQRTGLQPSLLQEVVANLEGRGRLLRVEDRFFSAVIQDGGVQRLLSRLEAFHESNPLKPGIPLEELRQVLPGELGSRLAEALLRREEDQGRVRIQEGKASLREFRPSLSKRQSGIRNELVRLLESADLAPPNLRELSREVESTSAEEVEAILRVVEANGEVVNLDAEFFFHVGAVRRAAQNVVSRLGGQRDLGPADFKEVLPVSRRHLLPLLRYFDLVGVTTRLGEGRDVAVSLPAEWGTEATGEM